MTNPNIWGEARFDLFLDLTKKALQLETCAVNIHTCTEKPN